jgi:hypothetical protein
LNGATISITNPSMKSLSVVSLTLLLFTGCAHKPAQQLTQPGLGDGPDVKVNTGVVRAVRGEKGDGQLTLITREGARNVKAGAKFSEGDTLETDDNTSADVFLGSNGPVIRLKPATRLRFDRLRVENRAGKVVTETLLDLQKGVLLGNVKKLSPDSKYEVKTRVGMVGFVESAEYNVNANGKVNIPNTNTEFQKPPRF